MEVCSVTTHKTLILTNNPII